MGPIFPKLCRFGAEALLSKAAGGGGTIVGGCDFRAAAPAKWSNWLLPAKYPSSMEEEDRLWCILVASFFSKMAAAVGNTCFVWENCVVWLNWLAALG